MAKKITLFTVLVVLAALVLVYFKRGGGVAPHLYKVQTATFYMVGINYTGKSTDSQLRTAIREVHDLLDQQQLKGTLSVVYEGNPDSNKPIKAFVGVIVEDTLQPKPANYVLRVFPAMKTVRAEIKAHVSVAPNPDQINAAIIDFARKSGLQLDSLYIEKYYTEEHIVADIKVKG